MGDAWRNNRGHWELSIGIYLDLQKALDPVDHSQLIRKLERCGIRCTGTIPGWKAVVDDYESTWKQHVRYIICKMSKLLVVLYKSKALLD